MFKFNHNVNSYLEVWKKNKKITQKQYIGLLKKNTKGKLIMLRTELVLPDVKEFTKHQQFKYYVTATKTVKP